MRACVSAGLTLCFLAGLVLPAAAADRRADLELVVNTVNEGDAVVHLGDDDAYVGVADLERAGIVASGTRVSFDAVPYVSLRSLEPRIRYKLDVDAVALNLTVDPSLLGSSQVDFDRRQATPPSAGAALGFANYAMSMGGFGGASAFGEAGARAGTGLVSSTAGFSYGRVRRGLSALVFDDPARLVRIAAGDAAISTGTLGGTTVVGGIGIARTFDLQPSFIRVPTPGISGTTLTPSTADIYVNGSLYQSVALPPGHFDLRNIPVPQGASVTRVVVRDALGGEQNLTSSFFSTGSALRKGLTDYDYELGFLRPRPFGTDDRYERPALLARYRLGASDVTALGGRLELTSALASGGPTLDMRLPFGVFSLTAAASAARGARGQAMNLAYGYARRRLSVGAALLAQSARYATVALDPVSDRATADASEYASVQLAPSVSFAAQHRATHFRDAPAENDLTLSATAQLAGRTSLTLTYDRMRSNGFALGGAGTRDSVFATVTASLGVRGDPSVSLATAPGSAVVAVQQAPPPGRGLGYAFQQNLRGQGDGAARLLERTPAGDVGVDVAAHAPPQLTVAGGVALFPGGVYFAPTIGDAFALVHVAGFEHMPVYLEHQQIGRTDGRGNLLLSRLTPYYANRISIDALDAPFEYEAAVTERTVAPRRGFGSLADFALRRVRAFTGRLTIVSRGRTIVPAFGSLTLERAGAVQTSDLGAAGEFTFENLQPGPYAAAARYRGATCEFRVTVPRGDAPFVRLGTLTCASDPQ